MLNLIPKTDVLPPALIAQPEPLATVVAAWPVGVSQLAQAESAVSGEWQVRTPKAIQASPDSRLNTAGFPRVNRPVKRD